MRYVVLTYFKYVTKVNHSLLINEQSKLKRLFNSGLVAEIKLSLMVIYFLCYFIHQNLTIQYNLISLVTNSNHDIKAQYT